MIRLIILNGCSLPHATREGKWVEYNQISAVSHHAADSHPSHEEQKSLTQMSSHAVPFVAVTVILSCPPILHVVLSLFLFSLLLLCWETAAAKIRILSLSDCILFLLLIPLLLLFFFFFVFLSFTCSFCLSLCITFNPCDPLLLLFSSFSHLRIIFFPFHFSSLCLSHFSDALQEGEEAKKQSPKILPLLLSSFTNLNLCEGENTQTSASSLNRSERERERERETTAPTLRWSDSETCTFTTHKKEGKRTDERKESSLQVGKQQQLFRGGEKRKKDFQTTNQNRACGAAAYRPKFN